MDELANFRFASPQLPILERELMKRADVVFTGGYSLYEAKRTRSLLSADLAPTQGKLGSEMNSVRRCRGDGEGRREGLGERVVGCMERRCNRDAATLSRALLAPCHPAP